jgi:hypothetical protein
MDDRIAKAEQQINKLTERLEECTDLALTRPKQLASSIPRVPPEKGEFRHD